MNMKRLIVVGVLIIIAVLIIINAAYFNFQKRGELKEVTEVLLTPNYEISINDYYEADYLWIDELEHNFDKYLAVDISIKNISEKKQKPMTLGHFFVDDGNYKLKSALIDENHKKFSKLLYPGDVFDITLTFPVDNANEYVLYYNKTLKAKDKKQLGFILDGTNLKKQEVPKTQDHFSLNKKKVETDIIEEETKPKTSQEEAVAEEVIEQEIQKEVK